MNMHILLINVKYFITYSNKFKCVSNCIIIKMNILNRYYDVSICNAIEFYLNARQVIVVNCFQHPRKRCIKCGFTACFSIILQIYR